MPSRALQKSWLLMLDAYFDDSGTGLDSPVFVIAGYVGDPTQWAEFSERWDAVLKKPHPLKPNGLAYFKASHAMARTGEFAGWTDEERDYRLRELLSLVPEYELNGVYVVIPIEPYRRIFTWFSHNTFEHPYFVALYGVFPTLMTYLDGKNIVDEVKFTFDRTDHRKKLESQWENFLRATPEKYRSRIVETMAFESEVGFPPLQAADAIAWYIRRQYHELEKENLEYRNEIFELLFDREHVSRVLSGTDIEFMRRAIPRFREGTIMSLPDPTSKLFGSRAV